MRRCGRSPGALACERCRRAAGRPRRVVLFLSLSRFVVVVSSYDVCVVVASVSCGVVLRVVRSGGVELSGVPSPGGLQWRFGIREARGGFCIGSSLGGLGDRRGTHYGNVSGGRAGESGSSKHWLFEDFVVVFSRSFSAVRSSLLLGGVAAGFD